MKAAKAIAVYSKLRSDALWRLLAADNAPIIIGILQTHLLESERALPASSFRAAVTRELEVLRLRGESLPQTASAYIADWLTKGFLERRFPQGVQEEEYSVSPSAARAIRFISSLLERRSGATETRLASVIHQLVRLAEETDPDASTRAKALLAERERIDHELQAIAEGRLTVLPDSRALERIHEILALSEGLVGDFGRVRERFEQLNKDFRRSVLEHEGSRGNVLDQIFADVDVIAESDEGRSFAAFWSLLNNHEQGESLREAIDSILERGFSKALTPEQRRSMRRITPELLTAGGDVHDVIRSLSRSLKAFVRSREYLEQRRIRAVLREAQEAALAVRDQVTATEDIRFELILSSAKLQSISQWVLNDPSSVPFSKDMPAAGPTTLDLDKIAELVAASDIDYRELKANVLTVLADQPQTSIRQLLERFPARQGLGSVVGYITLASRVGVQGAGEELIEWTGRDEVSRRAAIPLYYFVKEDGRVPF